MDQNNIKINSYLSTVAWTRFIQVSFVVYTVLIVVLGFWGLWEFITNYLQFELCQRFCFSQVLLFSHVWPYSLLAFIASFYWFYRLQGNKPNNKNTQSFLHYVDWSTRILFWKLIFSTGKINNVRSAHLLWVLLGNKGFKQILIRLGITQRDVQSIMENMSVESIDTVLNKSLELAYNNKTKVTWRELAKAMFLKSGTWQNYLESIDTKLEEAIAVVDWTSKYMGGVDSVTSSTLWQEIFVPKKNLNRTWTAKATPVLDRYSQNLTNLARLGLLTSAKVRHKEIDDAIQVLEKSQQNNLILVGDAGVGKTSIIGEIARRMISGKLTSLDDYKLISLDIGAMLGSGKKLQTLFSRAVREASFSGNTILFIGNLDQLAKAKSETGFDVSAILFDALQSKNLQLVGTSDPGNFKKYIENNKTLSSQFVRVNVPELDFDNVVLVLEDLSQPIEYHQGVIITLDAIKTAVTLSQKYIHTGKLPEKAENILDETAVYVSRKKSWLVTDADVRAVISTKTNVPVGDISADEKTKLSNLKDKIHERLIGQNEAVEAVVEALKRSRLGVSASGKRPIGSFLFLGPTGVGKTELAKSLAWSYFGDDTKMIRLDMGEYQTRESVHNLLGAPLVSGDIALSGGSFTEAVKKMPFAVILLDEIEKAHDEVLNIFLRMLDEGKMTDNLGNEIDFTNTMIIATSNAEARMIEESVRNNVKYSEIQKKLTQLLTQNKFKPEFINRFDGVIVFKPLSREESLQIVKLKVEKLKKRLLESKDISLKITDEAIHTLVEKGFDPAFGARPLERLIRKNIEGKVANALLDNDSVTEVLIDKNDILG